MKIDFDYKKTLRQLGALLARFQFILSFVLLMGFIGMAFWRINGVTVPEVDQKLVEEEISLLRAVEFDEEAIAEIEALRDSNVRVDPCFDNNRSNPFADEDKRENC